MKCSKHNITLEPIGGRCKGEENHYKIIDVLEQDVCFREEPERAFTDRSLVLSVLNHNADSEKDILMDGDTPRKYRVRVIIETMEL